MSNTTSSQKRPNGKASGRQMNPAQIVKVSGLNNARDKKAPGAFRTIREVAEELNVAQHVLRFWETKFTQVKPLKRGGGRRYYRPEDVALLKHIHHLLYTAGYTIKGVQKLFKGQTKNQIVAGLIESGSIEAAPAPVAQISYDETVELPARKTSLTNKQRSILEAMLGELKEMRSIVKKK
tara:strand:- start:108 stop:647 length:540 start_codon:yes stop_codon:yes gene_type:complete